MADNDLISRAKAAVASETVAPELKKRALDFLAKSGAATETPEQPGGFEYTSYKQPQSGSEVVGAPYEMSDDELVHETLAVGNDIDENLPTASKRISLKADPIYEGKQGIGAFTNSPFTYYEPNPEFLVNQLATYRDHAPEGQRKDIDAALVDLQTHGKKSKTYKESADRLWLETRAEFERDGVPVQRVAHAPATSYRTGVNKIAGNIAAPMLYGADQAMAFGLGSALWPTAAQDVMSGTSPEQKKVLERLRQRGVMPTEDESRGQEHDPVLSAAGGLIGLMAAGPMSLGGQAMKAGTKLEGELAARAPAFLRGTTWGSRMARSALGGATSAGMAGTGTQAVTEAFEADHGGEASLGDVAERGTKDALLGGGIGAATSFLGSVPGMARDAGKYMQDKLRTKPGLGDDLRALEDAGGSTAIWPGVRRSPEGQSLADEVLSPANAGKSQQQVALEPVADKVVADTVSRRSTQLAQMEHAEEVELGRMANRAKEKPYYLFNQLMETVRRKIKSPFGVEAPYAKALTKIADIKPMRKIDPAVTGMAKLNADEVRAIGLDPDQLLQKAYKSGLAGETPESLVFTIEVQPRSAGEINDATRDLASLMKFGKDPSSKDREMATMYEALVKTRELFGPRWAALKAKHEGVLQSLDDDISAIGLAGKDLEKTNAADAGDAAFNALSQYGKGARHSAKDGAVMKALRDSPAEAKRLRTHAGNEAYNRLSSGQSGLDVTSTRGLAKSALGGAALRFDPIYGAIGKGGAATDAALKSPVLRQKLQNLVGPTVELPDSLVDFVTRLSTTSSAATEKR